MHTEDDSTEVLIDLEMEIDRAVEEHLEMLKLFDRDPYSISNKATYHRSYERLHGLMMRWRVTKDAVSRD